MDEQSEWAKVRDELRVMLTTMFTVTTVASNEHTLVENKKDAHLKKTLCQMTNSNNFYFFLTDIGFRRIQACGTRLYVRHS